MIRKIRDKSEELEVIDIWTLLSLGLFDTAMIRGKGSSFLKDFTVKYNHYYGKNIRSISVRIVLLDNVIEQYYYSISQLSQIRYNRMSQKI